MKVALRASRRGTIYKSSESAPTSLGPGPVDISTQGTVRNANSVATIVSQINASAAGDTVVVAAGTYGYVTVSKSIGSGLIRIVPDAPGSVSIAGINMTSAQGLDWRGINTAATFADDGVWFQSSIRCRFRGGVHTDDPGAIAFMVQRSCSDIIIEDVLILNAWVGFYLQATGEGDRSTNVTIQRVRVENLTRDAFFGNYGDNITLQDFEFFGHTDSTEHSDGIQLTGLKNFTARRGHIWNTRAFRDSDLIDRNDHGVMVNYTDARITENAVFENLLIHDQTSQGINIAGAQTSIIIRNCTSYDNGLNGTATGINTDPDPSNVVTGLQVINCVFNAWFDSGEITFTTNTNNFVGNNSGPTGTNKLSGAPGFVDSANQNYALTSGSPNRGSGTATGAAVVDIYGVTRPSPPSRGAIE